jgi:hypothetical protein
MGPFSMFVEYMTKATGQPHRSGPILLKSDSEREASNTASAVADFAFSEFASDVLIRVIGSDGSGRPIAEVRRPMSNYLNLRSFGC